MTRPGTELPEVSDDHRLEIALIKQRLGLGAGTIGKLKTMVISALVGVIGIGTGVVFSAGRLDRTVEVQGQQIDRLERRQDDTSTAVIKLQDTVRNRLDAHDSAAEKRLSTLEDKLDKALAPKKRRR